MRTKILTAFVAGCLMLPNFAQAKPKFELTLEGGMAPFNSKKVIGDLGGVAQSEAQIFEFLFGGVSSYTVPEHFNIVFGEELQAALLFPIGKAENHQFLAGSVHFNYYHVPALSASASGLGFGFETFEESWTVESEHSGFMLGFAYGAQKPSFRYRIGIKVGSATYRGTVHWYYDDNWSGLFINTRTTAKLDGPMGHTYVRVDWRVSPVVGILGNLGFQTMKLSGLGAGEQVNGLVANFGVSFLFGKKEL